MIRVVVITDRRQFASEEIAGRIAEILAAVPRGAVAIQVREKDLEGGPLLRLVSEIVDVATPAGAEVWVNDRADVARVARAHGVHLPERGLPIADARAAVPTLSLSCSRHALEGVRAALAEGVAMIQLGPIWSSPGKGAPIGIAALRAARVATDAAKATPRLIAVGGIDRPERAHEAAAAGADAVAVIRAAWTSRDPGRTIAGLVDSVESGAGARV